MDPPGPHLRTSWLGDGVVVSSAPVWPCWVKMMGARVEVKCVIRRMMLGSAVVVMDSKKFCMSITTRAVLGAILGVDQRGLVVLTGAGAGAVLLMMVVWGGGDGDSDGGGDRGAVLVDDVLQYCGSRPGAGQLLPCNLI